MDFKTESYDEYLGELEGKPVVTSIKIDGENDILYSDNETIYLINKLGRVRKELPLLEEANSILKGKDKSIFIGELYGVDEEGNELDFNDTMSLIRKPPTEESEHRIRFAIFDALIFDGKKTNQNDYWERMTLVQELFEEGKNVHPVYAKKTNGSSVVKEMWEEHVVQKKHEGLVLNIEGDYIKIKPERSVDAAVIAVKPQKDKDLMGSLFVALMDEEGDFRSLSFVGSGTGLTKDVRREWFSWAKQNEARSPNEDELIWVDLNKTPRIVEIDYEQENIKENDTFKFSNGAWTQIEDKMSSTLRKPTLKEIRDDKSITKSDLRLNQIPELVEDKGKEEQSEEEVSTEEEPKKSHKIGGGIVEHEKAWKHGPAKYKYFAIGKDNLIYLNCEEEKGTLTEPLYEFDFKKYKDVIINFDEMKKDIEDRRSRKSFKLKAYYPKNPKTIIIEKNEYYSRDINEDKIWRFYDRVKHKIIKEVKGKHLLLWIRTNGDILKRKNEGLIHIDNTNDFNRINNGRMVEIHAEIAKQKGSDWYTNIIFCDLDPQDKFDWKETKALAKDIYNIFRKDSNVKKAKIHFSGSRGFHIIGTLRSSWDVNRARDYTKRLLKPLVTEKVKIGLVKENDMLRMDTTLIKKRGSLRSPYAIHRDTGLVALPIDVKQLDKFEKKQATLDRVMKNFGKKSFRLVAHKSFRLVIRKSFRLVIPKRFSIQLKSFKIKGFKEDPNSTENEIRWRLEDPADFKIKEFRRWSKWAGEKAPKGIQFLVGELEDSGDMSLQAIRFSREKWSENEAGEYWDKVKDKRGFEKTWTQSDWDKE